MLAALLFLILFLVCIDRIGKARLAVMTCIVAVAGSRMYSHTDYPVMVVVRKFLQSDHDKAKENHYA